LCPLGDSNTVVGRLVIILSMYDDEASMLEALRNGASSHVLKQSTAADLVRAVREVTAGRRYLSPPLSEHAIETYLYNARDAPLDLYDTLTAYEREVFQLAADGRTNVDLAVALFVSPRTVETHRVRPMSKLDLHTQANMIWYTLRRSILRLEP